jgi:hypothetical protein
LRVNINRFNIKTLRYWCVFTLKLNLAYDSFLYACPSVSHHVVHLFLISRGKGVKVKIEHLGKGIVVLPTVDQLKTLV